MDASYNSKSSMYKKPRTLVLCFDGTSNEYDADNTNVVKFFSLLKKDDSEQQLCYYQAGIGTFFEPGVVTPMVGWFAKILDYAIAWYLDQHVMNGYKFLMQNYRAGDKICLFGFSRGAYTARALAGMLYKVGQLPKDNPEQINFAMKLYKRTDKEGIELSKGFKQTFCYHVKIEFVGVWDTVSSVGVLRTKTLPFTNSNKAITTFRHALSLDERRTKFRANYYHRSSLSESAATLDPEHASLPSRFFVNLPKINGHHGTASRQNGTSTLKTGLSGLKTPGKSTLKAREVDLDPDTDVKEVWFAGDHGDVGGGHVKDSEPNALSNIPLRWMVKEVMESNAGIIFEGKALEGFHVDHGTIPHYFPILRSGKNRISTDDEGTLHPAKATSFSANEIQQWSENIDIDEVIVGPDKSAKQKAENEIAGGAPKDLEDVKSLKHDRLKTAWLWWLLEIIPTHYSWQDATGEWHREFRIHLGRGRMIHEKNPLFHYTVKERMEDKKLGYVPRAQWEQGSQQYVD